MIREPFRELSFVDGFTVSTGAGGGEGALTVELDESGGSASDERLHSLAVVLSVSIESHERTRGLTAAKNKLNEPSNLLMW